MKGVHQSFVQVNKLYYKKGHDTDCVVRSLAMLGVATPKALDHLYVVSSNKGLHVDTIIRMINYVITDPILMVDHEMDLNMKPNSFGLILIHQEHHKLDHMAVIHMRDTLWVIDPQIKEQMTFDKYVATHPFTKFTMYLFDMKKPHPVTLEIAELFFPEQVSRHTRTYTKHTPRTHNPRPTRKRKGMLHEFLSHVTRKLRFR